MICREKKTKAYNSEETEPIDAFLQFKLKQKNTLTRELNRVLLRIKSGRVKNQIIKQSSVRGLEEEF